MKIFTNKNITQKIILALVIVTLCNFTFPTCSRASIGGILVDPIVDLVTSVGDAILSVLQSYLYNGSFNVGAGLGSILSGASYFKSAIQDNDYKNFEDMKFSDPGNIAITIDSDNFDKFDVEALIPFIVSPVAGIISLTYSATTDSWMVPIVQYSVDKIFAGKIPAFDINFINPNNYEGDVNKQEASIAYSISNVIAEWYVSLRNLAIVILLSVLVYTGIRIVISSSADDRAKYKQRLIDWLIAMCLLFCMHYIMAFILEMIDILNDTIGTGISSIPVKISNGIQFNTDLMGLIRLQTQYKDFTPKVIYTIFYIGLLVYTCKFTWVYLKRTVTMAFLTIIAPFVAMTYPIDKMNDGKAQAFNAWLKEYIFTALLQPFHLIVYSVLVGSAMEIAINNPLYGILVIAFMGPAEKMLRKFFGFDKASTPGMLSQAGAMFGGAAAMNMLKRGAGHFIDKKAGGGSKNSGDKLRTVEDSNAPDGYDGFTGNNQTQNRNTQTTTNEQENKNNQTEGDDYSNRAFLAQNEYEENSQNTGNDWNDMYLNPQNYQSNDSGTGTTGSSTTDEQHRQAEEETNNSVKNSRLKAIGKRALVMPAAERMLSNTWSRKFANGKWKSTVPNAAKKAAIKTAKFAGKAAVAGTVGAIGIGMGIAGDDLEDVLKYGAAGTALGYAAAPGIGRKIANTGLTKNIMEDMDKAVYGSKEKADLARQTQALRDSGKMRNFVKETFPDKKGNPLSGEELNKMEERAIGHYNDGFTDEKELKKVMKLEDKMRKELQGNLPEEQANEQARVMSETIGKIARDITPGKLSDEKYRNGKLNEFAKGISKSNPELSQKEVNANAQQMMDYVMKYYKKP